MHCIPVTSWTRRFPSIEHHLATRPGGSDKVVDALSRWGRTESQSGIVSGSHLFNTTMRAQVLRKVILAAERSSAPGALVWPLLRMSPDMTLEVFEPLEMSLAEFKGANKKLFTLLKVEIGRNGIIPLALEAEGTSFALISAFGLSSRLGNSISLT
jgi:hypothetical protein